LRHVEGHAYAARSSTDRPAADDVLRMTWPQYSGSAIRLRQQKTAALLDIPVHPVLRAHLDGLSGSGASLTIVSYRGRPVPYLRFNERFRRVAERAGIDAQARDLRRTAMLRMARPKRVPPFRRSPTSAATRSKRRNGSWRPISRAIATLPRSRSPASPSTNGVQESNASLIFWT
jgi:hypothetical protein